MVSSFYGEEYGDGEMICSIGVMDRIAQDKACREDVYYGFRCLLWVYDQMFNRLG